MDIHFTMTNVKAIGIRVATETPRSRVNNIPGSQSKAKETKGEWTYTETGKPAEEGSSEKGRSECTLECHGEKACIRTKHKRKGWLGRQQF